MSKPFEMFPKSKLLDNIADIARELFKRNKELKQERDAALARVEQLEGLLKDLA